MQILNRISLLVFFTMNHVHAICEYTSESCGAGCWNENDLVLENGLRVCVPVGLGYSSPTYDNKRYQCPDGYFSGETETSASCKICPAGGISIAGFSTCFPCPIGFYQDFWGKSDCKQCDTTYYAGHGSNDFTYDPVTETIFCALTGVAPSAIPSSSPTAVPTDNPSSRPSLAPSPLPTGSPSHAPTSNPSSAPSWKPSQAPSKVFSLVPSMSPSMSPSLTSSSPPSLRKSAVPSFDPTISPTMHPSSMYPSMAPSFTPHWSSVIPESAQYVAGTILLVLSVLLLVTLVVRCGCCCCCCRSSASIESIQEEERKDGFDESYSKHHHKNEEYMMANAVIVKI